MIKEDVILILCDTREIILIADVSDHMPITFSWKTDGCKKGMAFKFNRAWLREDDYVQMIKDLWNEDIGALELSVWDIFHTKMQRIKGETKTWEISKKKVLRAELMAISHKINDIYTRMVSKTPNEDTFILLNELGDRKMEILHIDEITWKLKSRIKWLREGDLNTKFFQKTATDRRNQNAIWRIMKADGTYAITNEEIQHEAY